MSDVFGPAEQAAREAERVGRGVVIAFGMAVQGIAIGAAAACFGWTLAVILVLYSWGRTIVAWGRNP